MPAPGTDRASRAEFLPLIQWKDHPVRVSHRRRDSPIGPASVIRGDLTHVRFAIGTHRHPDRPCHRVGCLAACPSGSPPVQGRLCQLGPRRWRAREEVWEAAGNDGNGSDGLPAALHHPHHLGCLISRRRWSVVTHGAILDQDSYSCRGWHTASSAFCYACLCPVIGPVSCPPVGLSLRPMELVHDRI